MHYGLIGSFVAQDGQRDRLVALMLGAIHQMPGCLSYVVSVDPSDDVTIWVTEVWESEEAHTASLQQPAVREVIDAAMPLIAGFGQSVVTTPIGGHGLGG